MRCKINKLLFYFTQQCNVPFLPSYRTPLFICTVQYMLYDLISNVLFICLPSLTAQHITNVGQVSAKRTILRYQQQLHRHCVLSACCLLKLNVHQSPSVNKYCIRDTWPTARYSTRYSNPLYTITKRSNSFEIASCYNISFYIIKI